jgi:ppGpp synthetase/RelA/SpoT-type nucleotidyltranferase
MNNQEFLQLWKHERPMYEAWGDFVTSKICKKLSDKTINVDSFLKALPTHRVKDNDSLVDKAFYRENKSYSNPYEEIEDKVGCRFIVLLVEQIDVITDIIQEEDNWNYVSCRHFSDEREKSPLLFTYQSVHYVVRAKTDIKYNDLTIAKGTPCEIQIRTLLQHAYAELTHDAVYKSKKIVEPRVQRTIAKSMALIETTDDFFSDVNNSLTSSPSDDFNFQHNLDQLYNSHIKTNSISSQKSSIIILDEFESFIDDSLIGKLEVFIRKEEHIIELINIKLNEDPIYHQSIVIFIYWLIRKKKNALIESWPLNISIIQQLALDIGVSLDN